MGGDGPNSFDTLTALDAWVTRGNPPESIPATSTGRTMPLCPFPAAARYLGGPVTYAGSWTCPLGDRRLPDIGPDGVLAGANRDHRQ